MRGKTALIKIVMMAILVGDEVMLLLMMMTMMITMTKHLDIWNTRTCEKALENERQDSTDKNYHDGNTGGGDVQDCNAEDAEDDNDDDHDDEAGSEDAEKS